jgi:hypothetical protein
LPFTFNTYGKGRICAGRLTHCGTRGSLWLQATVGAGPFRGCTVLCASAVVNHQVQSDEKDMGMSYAVPRGPSLRGASRFHAVESVHWTLLLGMRSLATLATAERCSRQGRCRHSSM